jgi:hypothetical protein
VQETGWQVFRGKRATAVTSMEPGVVVVLVQGGNLLVVVEEILLKN